MSSACVCHIEGEFCFYCEVYSPEVKRMRAEIAAEEDQRRHFEVLSDSLARENGRLREALSDILGLIDGGYLYGTKMSSAVNYVVRRAREVNGDVTREEAEN